MFFASILFAFGLLPMQLAKNPLSPDFGSIVRIVGGELCEIETHPFVIFLDGKFICGGSLLTLSYIVTAAHCVVNNEESVKNGKLNALAGCTHASHKQSVSRRVQWAKKHVKFGNKQYKYDIRYDIGIMRTEKSFEESKSVIPVHLYRAYYNDCSEAMTLGWGLYTDEDPASADLEAHAASRQLHCVNLPLISLKECRELWPSKYVFDETVTCTLYKKGGKDACFGDSGGPLVCRTAQIGIISAGKGCAEANAPALYTRIDMFIDYIEETANVRFVPVSNIDGNEIVKAVELDSGYRVTTVPLLLVVCLANLPTWFKSAAVLLWSLCQAIAVDYHQEEQSDCEVQNYPFIVSIIGSIPCAGSLINMEYILTSAYCIQPEEISSEHVYAMAGYSYQWEFYNRFPRPNPFRLVVQGVRHPKYKPIISESHPYEMGYDLGIIRIETPFTPSDTIQPISLGNSSGMTCTSLIAIGWNGRNANPIPLEIRRNYRDFFTRAGEYKRSDYEDHENHLRCVKVNVVEANECRALWPLDFFIDESICTRVQNDSLNDWGLCVDGGYGGALVCNGELMAVISTGFSCPATSFPELASRIEGFEGFIRDVVGITVDELRRKGNLTDQSSGDNTMQYLSHCLLLLLIWLMLIIW